MRAANSNTNMKARTSCVECGEQLGYEAAVASFQKYDCVLCDGCVPSGIDYEYIDEENLAIEERQQKRRREKRCMICGTSKNITKRLDFPFCDEHQPHDFDSVIGFDRSDLKLPCGTVMRYEPADINNSAVRYAPK